MLVLVALLQVSLATPSHLDDARRALHAADTTAAVAMLTATIETDTLYDAEDLAALVLLRWIGRTPKYRKANEVWERGLKTVRGRMAFAKWTSQLAFTALSRLGELDQGQDDRDIQEGSHHYVSEAYLIGRGMPGATTIDLGPADSLRGPSWQARLRAQADDANDETPLAVAGARWVATVGWLSNLNRFAYDEPTIDAPLGCQHGCLLLRQPPANLPLLQRFRETGPGAASLDTLWAVRNRAPTVFRAATLDSLWAALNDLRPGPWPYNELAERLRVTVCALLRLSTQSSDCAPVTNDLDDVVAAELQAVRYEVEGHRRLAERAMDAAPERFAALDRSIGLLVADAQARDATVFTLEGYFSLEDQVPERRGPQPPDFWRASWPLYLEPYNERLVAHRARLLLADMSRRLAIGREVPNLFDAYGEQSVLVRLGVPLALARPRGHWTSRVPLVTYVMPGTHETVVWPKTGMEGVALDFALAARSGVNPTTVSGFVAEDYDSFRALDHQVVQYARAPRQLVDVYTRWRAPEDCTNPQPVLAFFLLDAQLRQLSQTIEPHPMLPPFLKRFQLEPAPGSYVYSLEMLDRACRVAERARYVLTVPSAYLRRVSDLMLADELSFGDERWVERIAGRPPVVMHPSLTLAGGDVARFYWEVYGIDADAMQAGRLEIRFEVVNVKNQRVAVREIGRLAQQARKRAGTLDIRYELAVPAGEGPLGFGLAVGIPKGTTGVHVARVRVTDTKTKQRVTAERAFFVRE